MKKIIQIIGLVVFILFGFFYTDKVLEVVREEDNIMIKLNGIKDMVRVNPIDAVVTSDTVIPGVNGRDINIDKSYKAMKNTGIFNEKDIVYDVVYPDVSVIQHKDKFLIQGNGSRQMVSLIFILDSNKYLDKINSIVDNKGIVVNYFVNYGYLISNSTKIKDISNHEFYSYGDNGNYTPDNILFSNNLISRISNNNANLCLTNEMNKNILELCSRSDLYTIVPTIDASMDAYNMVKNHLSSGSMILLRMNQDTIRELGIIIDYIKGKGLKIGGLSRLLTEKLD